jgi:hypothetical protein
MPGADNLLKLIEEQLPNLGQARRMGTEANSTAYREITSAEGLGCLSCTPA